MIKKTILISSADSDVFCEKFLRAVNMLQDEGLTVDVKYHPVTQSDDGEYVVYTALLIGRTAIS